MPLLFDLAQAALLHDDSVAGLHALLDPKRGAEEPHPFSIKDAEQRAALAAFLESLGGSEAQEEAKVPDIKKPGPAPKDLPRIPKADPAAVPDGYRVEVFPSGFAYPSSIEPLMRFDPHTSVCKIDFDREGRFGPKGAMYLAASGDYAPITAEEQKRTGYWVKRVDGAKGTSEDFFRARKDALGPKDLEHVTTAGPRRPVDVRFGPDGALYVVDIGPVMFVPSAQGPTPRPFPCTVWRISRIAPC